MTYTENIADFSHWHRMELIQILKLWNEHGLPQAFYEGGVKLAMNTSSGSVFVTNEEYQVCMRNPQHGKLAMWYSTPYDGHEGFLEDLIARFEDLHEEDQSYLHEVAIDLDCQIVHKLRKSSEVGAVCWSQTNDEFGVLKGEQVAWFPSSGECSVLFVEVDAFPACDD